MVNPGLNTKVVKLKIGFIGLGRMGKNMVYNLIDKGHEVVANNRSPDPVTEVGEKGAIEAYSIEEMIENLPEKKIVWLMVAAGKPIDIIIDKLIPMLKKGDIIIDGGNSYFEDSIRRYKKLKGNGIGFLDCGTSGGISGARNGACMMIGGDKKVFDKVEKLFKDMCVKDGYDYMGKSGAGHFIKAVHNGIEYGMMGAIGEGFEAIKKQVPIFGTDLKKVAKVYAHGSIIESKLMSWLADGMESHYFNKISGEVPKGETEEEMKKIKKMSDMPILNQAIKSRESTRKKKSFNGKVVAVMRNQFGGHSTKKNGDDKK